MAGRGCHGGGTPHHMLELLPQSLLVHEIVVVHENHLQKRPDPQHNRLRENVGRRSNRRGRPRFSPAGTANKPLCVPCLPRTARNTQ